MRWQYPSPETKRRCSRFSPSLHEEGLGLALATPPGEKPTIFFTDMCAVDGAVTAAVYAAKLLKRESWITARAESRRQAAGQTPRRYFTG